MIEKIYSQKNKNTLLHMIVRYETQTPRVDVSPETEYLQLASLNMQKGQTFRPHKHIWKPGESEVIAQESWVVIEGKVKVILYDLDDTIIHETILNQGDASVTFQGGHNYEILKDGTHVYEYKTGPYQGQKLDKVFIGEQDGVE